MSTPQGFDPFISEQYRTTVEARTKFATNRIFYIDPTNESLLQFFGIRWVLLTNGSTMEKRLREDARFRKMAVAVDGGTAAMYRAEGTFQGTMLPAGSHEVHFDYAPGSLLAGAGISMVSLMFLAASMWIGRRTRKGIPTLSP